MYNGHTMTMTIDESLARRRIHLIADHVEYFVFLCLTGSMEGAAEKMLVHPKSVSNHIKWIERFAGKKIVQKNAPGHTTPLSAYGKQLFADLESDFLGTIKKLDADKVEDLLAQSFVETIKGPVALRKKRK